jgi:REP element-mobilizing transposase RayT
MSLTNLLYHLVFATQDRHQWITDEIEQRLYEYLGGIIRGQRGTSLEINGVEDHVHMLAKLHQSRAVADVPREELIALLNAHRIEFDEKYLLK